MLEITYKNGRGRMQIDLVQLLPCSKADFTRLLSIIELSNVATDHAKTVYDYITGQVAELKSEREQLDANSAIGKEKIAKINATIKKYLSLADILVKNYELPEISDDDAKTILRVSTVYSLMSDHGKASVESHDGWTFEKVGYVFDVYKKTFGRSTYYYILLHGTGTMVAEARKKNAIISEITPKLLESLSKSSKKITETAEIFKKCMIGAGFMEVEERRETILKDESEETEVKNEEVATMENYSFTPDSVSIDGKTFPAEFNIIASGTVLVFAITGCKDDGRKIKQRIKFTPDHADYAAALAAAKGETLDHIEERTEIISGNVPDETSVIDDPKKARGPVPEKTFIGNVIQGNGWKIFFDGEKARTRIIFDSKPTDAARIAVENAGFYFSSNMNSWNKKLTFKAYRAAKAVSCELMNLYAA